MAFCARNVQLLLRSTNFRCLPSVRRCSAGLLENDTDAAITDEKFERILRQCAYSPSFKSASERRLLLGRCIEFASDRKLVLTVKQHNFILQTNVVSDQLFSGREYMAKMSESGAMPNEETYQLCVLGECAAKRLESALQLIEEMKSKDIEVKDVVYSALISIYCQLGRFPDAYHVLERLKASSPSCYLMLLRGAVQFGSCENLVAALDKLRNAHAVVLDPIQFRKLIEIAGEHRYLEKMDILLAHVHLTGGQPLPGLRDMMKVFIAKHHFHSCHRLLLYFAASNQLGLSAYGYGNVGYFVRLVLESGLPLKNQIRILHETDRIIPAAQIPSVAIKCCLERPFSAHNVAAHLWWYRSNNVHLQFDVMGDIQQSLAVENSPASVLTWIKAFQLYHLPVPDQIWFSLVSIAADTAMPVSEFKALLASLKPDIFTLAAVLKAMESCRLAIPSSGEYLSGLAHSVADVNADLHRPLKVQPHSSVDSPDFTDDVDSTGTASLDSMLAEIDALVPSAPEEAAVLLERALPGLMLADVKDAFLLAAHFCDKRHEVACLVAPSCFHGLQTALHDSKLPLHFFRLSLSLRNAGIAPPSNWLELSLPMHIQMKNSSAVDDIFQELCLHSSGDAAALPSSLVAEVFSYLLSTGRPSDVISSFGKLADPAASDNQLLGIALSAYLRLGDVENAEFLMEKLIASSHRPAGRAVLDMMDWYVRRNEPDTAWLLYTKLLQRGHVPDLQVLLALAQLLASNDRIRDVQLLLSQTQVRSQDLHSIIFSALVANGNLGSALDFAVTHPVSSQALSVLVAAPFKFNDAEQLKKFLSRLQAVNSSASRQLYQHVTLLSMALHITNDQQVLDVMSRMQASGGVQAWLFEPMATIACQDDSPKPTTAVLRMLVLLHKSGQPIDQFADLFMAALANGDRREKALVLAKFAKSAGIVWGELGRQGLQQLGLGAYAEQHTDIAGGWDTSHVDQPSTAALDAGTSV